MVQRLSRIALATVAGIGAAATGQAGGPIAPVTGDVSPLYGKINPFYGDVNAAYGKGGSDRLAKRSRLR